MISSVLVEVDTTMSLPDAGPAGGMPAEPSGLTHNGTNDGSQAGSGEGGGNGENEERRTRELPVTAPSRNAPLARQPIFNIGNGGVAGQNLVCR